MKVASQPSVLLGPFACFLLRKGVIGSLFWNFLVMLQCYQLPFSPFFFSKGCYLLSQTINFFLASPKTRVRCVQRSCCAIVFFSPPPRLEISPAKGFRLPPPPSTIFSSDSLMVYLSLWERSCLLQTSGPISVVHWLCFCGLSRSFPGLRVIRSSIFRHFVSVR